jgi:hypothetical protein
MGVTVEKIAEILAEMGCIMFDMTISIDMECLENKKIAPVSGYFINFTLPPLPDEKSTSITIARRKKGVSGTTLNDCLVEIEKIAKEK